MASKTISLTKEKIEKLKSKSVRPPTKTKSNFDLLVETVFFFEAPKGEASPTLDIARVLKKAIGTLLDTNDLVAGRLKFNQQTKSLELLRNNAGVSFVTAESSLIKLNDLGSLSLPNPTFHDLMHCPGLDNSLAEKEIFTIKVTRFKCGGFSLGFMTNHAILDGKSVGDMLQNLASLCREDGVKVKPVQPNTSSTSLFLSFKFVDEFSFTPKCSTFEAIVAHIWRVRTKAMSGNQNNFSTVLFAVDMSSDFSPQSSNEYAGNAVIKTFATAKVSDLIGPSLDLIVEKVKEAIKGITDTDEKYKGNLRVCNWNFSAWWKLPFEELDFGHGKSVHRGRIVGGHGEFIVLLCKWRGGINVCMGLEKEKMKTFKAHVSKI